MTQIKIGLTGVHGSGKTTQAKELQMYYNDCGKSVHMVGEVARICPLPLGTIEAQEWIWYHQMSQEKCGMSLDVDVVICDRTVMGNLVYYRDVIENIIGRNRVYLQTAVRWWDLYREARDWMPTYTEVIRLPLNLEWLHADDPIRSKDVAYARRIDALFDRFVQPYVTTPVSF